MRALLVIYVQSRYEIIDKEYKEKYNVIVLIYEGGCFIFMEVSEEVRKEYFNALYNQQNGNNEPMKRFKASHFDVYKIINAMYHKRVKVLKDINVMREVSRNKVYFGSLTFNEIKDKNLLKSKRREVFNFLNTIFLCFLLVEEEGEHNQRYHVHYVGIFRDNKTFADLFAWHSREDIQRVKSARSVARYLCNYIVKQVPRIRRNKTLIKVSEEYKKARYFAPFGQKHTCLANEILFLNDLEEVGC